MKLPRSSPWMSGSTTTTPSITSDGRILAIWPSSVQLDHRVVAEHEPQRPGPSRRSGQLDLAADEAVGEAGDVDDAAAGEHHGVLQLGVDDLAVGADRAEGADVAVHHAGARPDDGGSEDPAVHDLGAGLDDDPALDGRPGVYRSLDPRLQRLEHQPVALEQRILLARVDPPALEDLVVDAMAMVDQPLDGVGDLQLTPPRRRRRRRARGGRTGRHPPAPGRTAGRPASRPAARPSPRPPARPRRTGGGPRPRPARSAPPAPFRCAPPRSGR